MALLRFTLASAALLSIQRFRAGASRIAREDIPRLLLLGFLVLPVNQGFFLFGLSRTTPSHAGLLYALTPLVVLLLARRILHERNLWSKLAGVLVAFLGVAIIFLERGLAHEAKVLSGDVLILVAVFGWSLYTVLSKPLLAKYDSMTVTAWAIISGSLYCVPAFFIPGAIPPLGTITPAVWGGILYLSIGTSVIAYPLWLYALRHLEASKVAIATNVQPILTVVLSWLIFRERFTPGFFIGAAMILAGLAWVESRRGA